MNLKQLRLMREIVRSNFNVTEAASAVYASQSGVSKHVKDLEDELGVVLFRRRGKRLLGLTEPGEQVLKFVDRVLLETDNIRRVANELSGAKTGTLTIATTHTQSRYALPKLFVTFRQLYPDVEIVLLQGHSREVPAMLVDGRADIGLATDTLTDVSELITFPSYSWEHCAVVPRDHPLVAMKNVTVADIAEFPVVTYERGLTGRNQIDRAFADAGADMKVSLSALDSDVIKTYVELGFGVGILASMAYDSQRDRGLRKLNTNRLFEPSTTSVAIRRGRFLKEFAYRFIEMCAPTATREAIEQAEEAAHLQQLQTSFG